MPNAAITCLAAVLSVWPLAAWADLPAPVSAALEVCRADGPSLADRADALIASGWQPLRPDDRPAAAQALAPYELIRIGRISADDTTARRAELLLQSATYLLSMMNRELEAEVWFSLPDSDAFLNVMSRIPTIVECDLSADLSPELLAAAFQGPIDVQEHPPMTLHYFMAGDSRLDSPVLITFAPDAFGALPILPILATPPVAAAN